MKVTIAAYGIAREITGQRTEVDVQHGTVGELRKVLLASYPALGNLSSLMVAVNQEYASDDLVLKPGDEVVLIPPVSGG